MWRAEKGCDAEKQDPSYGSWSYAWYARPSIIIRQNGNGAEQIHRSSKNDGDPPMTATIMSLLAMSQSSK